MGAGVIADTGAAGACVRAQSDRKMRLPIRDRDPPVAFEPSLADRCWLMGGPLRMDSVLR